MENKVCAQVMKALSECSSDDFAARSRNSHEVGADRPEGAGPSARPVAPRVDLRLALAVVAGRLVGAASRALRFGGGTTLPGRAAEIVDGSILRKLAARLTRGVILVTGTNGKTTTSRILATILETSGLRIISNRGGANLRSGIVSALLYGSRRRRGRLPQWGVFEVDEAAMPAVAEATQPKIIIITNLFRDQLDRYGEIDFLTSLWRETLGRLDDSTAVVLDVDDPRVAALGRGLAARTFGFGVDIPEPGSSHPESAADSTMCPVCGTPLIYTSVQYSHLGRYSCPKGDFSRPNPDLAITAFAQHELQDAEIGVTGDFGTRRWKIALPGLYNGYNFLAAASGALLAGAPMGAVDSAAALVRAPFGRFERMSLHGRSLCVVLVKNPVGLTEVVRTILSEEHARYVAILLNDRLADGTDVSWIWDADLRGLAKGGVHIIVGGTRADDLALRLKYAGVPLDRVDRAGSVKQALRRGLELVPEGEILYTLPTYTAMIELHKIAARQGNGTAFWKN